MNKYFLRIILLITCLSAQIFVYSQVDKRHIYLDYKDSKPYYCMDKEAAIQCLACLESVPIVNNLLKAADTTITLQMEHISFQNKLIMNLFNQRDAYQGMVNDNAKINNALKIENLVLQSQLELSKSQGWTMLWIGTGAGAILGTIIIVAITK